MTDCLHYSPLCIPTHLGFWVWVWVRDWVRYLPFCRTARHLEPRVRTGGAAWLTLLPKELPSNLFAWCVYYICESSLSPSFNVSVSVSAPTVASCIFEITPRSKLRLRDSNWSWWCAAPWRMKLLVLKAHNASDKWSINDSNGNQLGRIKQMIDNFHSNHA